MEAVVARAGLCLKRPALQAQRGAKSLVGERGIALDLRLHCPFLGECHHAHAVAHAQAQLLALAGRLAVDRDEPSFRQELTIICLLAWKVHT